MSLDPLSSKAFDEIENSLLSITVSVLKNVGKRTRRPQKKRRFEKGHRVRKINSLLNSNYDVRIKAALRISKETFYRLRHWLVSNTELRSSKHISVEVKLVIFLVIIT